MQWNYRGYGRSKGQPDPYNTYHDGESMLKFILEEIGAKAQIGCFGRSIGGTIATHVANQYPQHVKLLFIDRSLGTLDKMSESNFVGDYSRDIL